MEHLPVVGGGMVVRGEVRADSELLEDDRPAQASGELAGKRGREELAHGIVLHRIRVGAEEIDERRKGSQRITIVLAGDLHAPGAVADRNRLRRASGPHGLREDAGPRRDVGDGGAPAVERHLVREEPAGDRVQVEPPGDLTDEPRLLPDEPDVPVEIASLSPGWIPVLPGHVADDERRDRLEPELRMRVQKVAEPVEDLFVERLGLRDEIRPVAERARDGAAVIGENPQLIPHNRRVVVHPHPRPAGARPEVRPDPRRRSVPCERTFRLGSHRGSHPDGKSPSLIRFSVNQMETVAAGDQRRRTPERPSPWRAGPVLPRGVSSPRSVSLSSTVRPSMTSRRCRIAVTP